MRFTKITISMYKCADPQKRMRELGFTYLFSVPQSMFDSWEFYGCEIEKDKFTLPNDIANVRLKRPPHELIGYGLTKEHAEKLQEWISGGE